MAMPASGQVAIISAPQTCGSICAAVRCTSASGSLSALSVAAGKTAPHAMSEFYGYVQPAIALGLVSQTSCASSTVSYCSACLCGVSFGGNCACVCAYYNVGSGGASKTAGIACVLCNTVAIVSCTVSGINSATASFSFTIRAGDSVIFCVRGQDTLVTTYGDGLLCICTVTGIVGNYCLNAASRYVYASAGFV